MNKLKIYVRDILGAEHESDIYEMNDVDLAININNINHVKAGETFDFLINGISTKFFTDNIISIWTKNEKVEEKQEVKGIVID